MSRDKYWSSWRNIAQGAVVNHLLEKEGVPLEDIQELTDLETGEELSVSPKDALEIFEGAKKTAYEGVSLSSPSDKPSIGERLVQFADSEPKPASEEDRKRFLDGDPHALDEAIARARAQAFAKAMVGSGRASISAGRLGGKLLAKTYQYGIKKPIQYAASRIVHKAEQPPHRLSGEALSALEAEDPELQKRLEELRELAKDPFALQALFSHIRGRETARSLLKIGKRVGRSYAFFHDFMMELMKESTPQLVSKTFKIGAVIKDRGTRSYRVPTKDPGTTIAILDQTIGPQIVATIPVLPFSGLVSCTLMGIRLKKLARQAELEKRPFTAHALRQSSEKLMTMRWIALGAQAADAVYGASFLTETAFRERMKKAPVTVVEPYDPSHEETVGDLRPSPKSRFGKSLRGAQDFLARVETAWERTHEAYQIESESRVLTKADPAKAEQVLMDAANELVESLEHAGQEQKLAINDDVGSSDHLDAVLEDLAKASEAQKVVEALLDAAEHKDDQDPGNDKPVPHASPAHKSESAKELHEAARSVEAR